MKIYLDDFRIPPSGKGWIIVRSFIDFFWTWENHKQNITEISFDHDLGTPETGYDALKLVEEDFIKGYVKDLPFMSVHSANPSGRDTMELTINRLYERRTNESKW